MQINEYLTFFFVVVVVVVIENMFKIIKLIKKPRKEYNAAKREKEKEWKRGTKKTLIQSLPKMTWILINREMLKRLETKR